MKTKQIVVNKHWGHLLTPYWTVEYLKRKDINIYCYEEKYDSSLNIIGYKLRNPNELNDFKETYCEIKFLKKNLGDVISTSKFDKNYLINKFILFKDREDKDLVEIAKLINNDKQVKIIEIPSDVGYIICNYEHSEGEYIEEQHRVWH